MQIIEDVKLDFDDVLIKPKRSKLSSRSDVDLFRTYWTPNSKRQISGVPIIASNMDVVGTFAMADAFKSYDMFVALHKYYKEEQLAEYLKTSTNTFFTVGVKEEDLSKLKQVGQRVKIDRICVDVANGYSEYFLDKVKKIRDMFPDAIIMAGNVATPEMVQELIISGAADIVKVGIGSGSQCETRIVSGVGYPQFSAIVESADVAHGLNGLICSDGGIRTPGDVVKAFASGADFVMLGGFFAGYEENEGEWEYGPEVIREKGVPKYTGKEVKQAIKFYGMSSQEAMERYSDGVSEYKTSEGKSSKIPYKGYVKDAVQRILGGLRSGCTYCGASRLKDLSKCATFIKVNRVHYQNVK